jgi:hypothetical protein
VLYCPFTMRARADLMELNFLASRSYNDITQYPVFPWVLTHFATGTLDLNDPSVFRDLTRPVGAQDSARADALIERFSSFPDEGSAFHYGTHYSSAALVTYFLLRLMPFTALSIELQNGRFDCPDRLFDSLEGAWKGTQGGASDVKELIPEFYYLPAFLLNSDELPLGVKEVWARVCFVCCAHVAHCRLRCAV